jgi:CRISPR-associated endonuclease Csn1
MKKIGFDLGSSSVGWFLRDGENVLKFGAVVFNSGMQKGTSGYSSPTKDRREYRLKRNPIKARKYRKKLMLKTLLENNMVPLKRFELKEWTNYAKGKKKKFPDNPEFKKWLACDFSFNDGKTYKNPYELRVKSLDEQLTKLELGRSLYHLAQRRGFKDIGEKNEETKKQIERRKESGFQSALSNHRTIAEALQKEYLEKNCRARDNYPYRDEYEDELKQILIKQGYSVDQNDQGQFVDPFVKAVRKAIIWQQPLKTQKESIGKCTFEPKKRRCALSHPLFEISRAWQFINTIKYKEVLNDDYQFISQEQRNIIFSTVFLRESTNFKFEKIRNKLDRLFQKKMFYNYRLDTKIDTYESTVAGMPFCKGVIKIFGDQAKTDLDSIEQYNQGNMPKNYNGYSLLDIWHNVTEFDAENLSEFGTQKLNLPLRERKRKREIETFSPLVDLKETLPKGYGNLSQFVLKKTIPLLKNGYLYNDAVLLANLKDALGNKYEEQKNKVSTILNEVGLNYNEDKIITRITNHLIEIYKGKEEANRNGEENELFAQGDFNYVLQDSDTKDVIDACKNHFGENKWESKRNKEELINKVGKEYQEFFFDLRRYFRGLKSIQERFEDALHEEGIELKKPLYHHSKLANIYGDTIQYRDTDIEILPLAKTNSIKNPMFNKALSILRKVVNQLIVDGIIDQETEVTIEIARELNDNNKRIAIERFQKQREAKRNKIRTFLEEFKSQEKSSLNVEESIQQFELWDEQIFEETEDENGLKRKNSDRNEILKEKNSIKRYELWMEQQGQCMYTGKMISINQLFSAATEIEHTIARKLLPDNTLANETIAFKLYNTNIKKTLLPVYLPNFSKDVSGTGTAIEPRLLQWQRIRDKFRYRYQINQKASGNEDEKSKNERIQNKHFNKMHFDYWNDKLERFTETDVTDRWARRQLTDTQNISKYAREFLKTYFHKVGVQKGSTTAEFRKMLGLEDSDNPKDRSLHTHHIIDASVLTYIPTNASRRDRLIKMSYKSKDEFKKQFHYSPHANFNVQRIKRMIENETLIFNYTKDNVTTQTFKKVRKSGRIVAKKDENGDKIILSKNGENIQYDPVISRGDTIRTSLFADSFLGKIKDVERYDDGIPKRNIDGSDWEYKKGDDEFLFVKRDPIDKINRSNLKDIVDPALAKLIESQLGQETILDWQGNKIRHVRLKKRSGRKVKSRVDYKSEKDYKNYYYAESGSIPYGVMALNPTSNERFLLQVHAYQISKIFNEYRNFDIEAFVQEYYPELTTFKKLLLRVGQKLIVFNNDEEYSERKDKTFQRNRLYKITKIDNGSLWLKYHLTATADNNLDLIVKEKKDEILWQHEKGLGLSKVTVDESIEDMKERNDDFERRKFKVTSYTDYRLKRIVENFGREKASEIKSELSIYKKVSSSIEVEGETHLLKLNTSNSWNFLYEGEDFKLSILGDIKIIE